jgi:Protein of unknown function (DUF3365)/Protein kinase domain
MHNYFARGNLRTKFFLWSTAVLIGFGLLVAVLNYRHLKRAVMAESLQKSELILSEVEAIRAYVKEELRPLMQSLHSRDTFIIEAMSTTYISRRIMERFGESMPGFVYRRVSVNPHNPRNLADEFEEEMIDWFEATPERRFWQGVVQKGDASFFISMVPDYFEQSCILCHGNPGEAPRTLVETYGNDGGFRFKAGDLAGLNSVAVPVSGPLQKIRRFSVGLFAGTVVGTLSLLLLLNWLFNRLVISRLTRIMDDLSHDDGQTSLKGGSRTVDGSADELDNLKTSLGQLNRYVQAARKGGGLEPNVIGPYVVGRPLVAGTLSWVYQARDTRTNDPVSIKIPFEDVLINPIYAACLQSELNLLGTIQHPGIIKIRERQGDALVLAPVTGIDFERHLQQHPQPAGRSLAALFEELMDITAYLHHQGVVHHDLRPANFIVGEDGRLCLVDLGMAAHRDYPDPITASGMGPQGDVRYMPPEQWDGVRGDPRADIYTLGVLLYRMTAGRLPFEDSVKAYKFLAHNRGEILPPSYWQPHLSKPIETVIMKAIAAAPQDRYQWVEDFGEALAAVLPTS